MLSVDIVKQLGDFTLKAAFKSNGLVTGLFGNSGAGKTTIVNMIAGLTRPDRGLISLDGETLDDTEGAFTFRLIVVASATSFRMRGYFRISMSDKISTMGAA